MKSLISIFILTAGSMSIAAQNNFDHIINQIIDGNPELAVVRSRNSLESATLEPENNLADPEIEFTHQWGQKGIGTKWGIDASQSFDWPGLYAARKKANAANRTVFEKEYEVRRNEVIYEARCGVTDAFFARKKVMLQTHQLNIIDSLQKIYEKGASKGEVSMLDVNKLKIERIRIASRLTDANLAYEDAMAKLLTLSGGKKIPDIDGNGEYPTESLLPTSVYLSRAADSSPYMHLAMAQDKAADEALDVNQKSNLPGFNVGYMHEYELGEHFNGIKLGMTLPFFSNRHKKEVIIAQKELIKSELSAKQTEIESGIKTDCRMVSRLDGDIASFIEALTTNDNPRLLGIALSARHITLIQYLTEMNYFLEAAENLIDLQCQREQIMNRLLRY